MSDQSWECFERKIFDSGKVSSGFATKKGIGKWLLATTPVTSD